MYQAKRQKIKFINDFLEQRGYTGSWQIERELQYPSRKPYNEFGIHYDAAQYDELLKDRKEWADEYRKYWNEERGCFIATAKDGSKEQISHIIEFKIGKTYYLVRVLLT